MTKFVLRIPDNAKYIGHDFFDQVCYYESSRFLYTFFIVTKKIVRSNKTIIPNIDFK